MSSPSDRVEVRILSRPGCPLCDEMKGAAEAFLMWYGFEIEVVNVLEDAALAAEYADWVPQLFVNGKLACKFHLDPARFGRMLEEAGAGKPR